MKQNNSRHAALKIELICKEYYKKKDEQLRDRGLTLIQREQNLDNYLYFLCEKHDTKKSAVEKIIYSKN